jgi:hypothetical protein
MDAGRFDALTRSLTAAGSRRRALALALSGAMGVRSLLGREEAQAHNALEACKKKSGKQKKKCLKKARAHNATHTAPPCIGSCAGKLCGDDGCGHECGVPCTHGHTCQDGRCLCPSGTQLCQGECVDSSCGPDSELNLSTCTCCGAPGSSCDRRERDDGCCSGVCIGNCSVGGNSCLSNAQCTAGGGDICVGGFCTH